MGNRVTFKRTSDRQEERICPTCGNTLFVTVYRQDCNHSFCNKQCFSKWQNKYLSGPNNPRFKGGKGYVRKDGRVRLYMPDHPNATKNGLVYRYRVVAERMLGRYLTPDEHVHHKDLDCSNDDPSNLEVLTKSEHMRLHQILRREARLAAA